MDIQFPRFVDVGPHTLEDAVVKERLSDMRLGGDEETGCFVAGVGGPVVGRGYGEESAVLGEGGKDFERFGQFTRAVAGEEVADSNG